MFDWNDLKYLVAVARHQSTTAASRALGVNQSTVQRRLVELERCMGQALVHRHPSGYRLTAFGEQVLPLAQRVEQAVVALTQHVDVFRREVTGVVRMTCPEPLVYRISNSTLLERFHTRYPGLHVEFVTSDQYLDFAGGDVDVALRSGDTEDNALIGRKVGDSLWAVYASPKYIARCGQPDRVEDLARHDWVGFDEAMAKHRAAKWLQQVTPDAHVVARNTSVLGLVNCWAPSRNWHASGACSPPRSCDTRPAWRRCSTFWWMRSMRCGPSSRDSRLAVQGEQRTQPLRGQVSRRRPVGRLRCIAPAGCGAPPRPNL